MLAEKFRFRPWLLFIATAAATGGLVLVWVGNHGRSVLRKTVSTHIALSPEKAMCRVEELATVNGSNVITARFVIREDGSFIGCRYDVWESYAEKALVGSYRGTIGPAGVSNLMDSVAKDRGWQTVAGLPNYQYGMVDYGKFNHPTAVDQFVAIAVYTDAFYSTNEADLAKLQGAGLDK